LYARRVTIADEPKTAFVAVNRNGEILLWAGDAEQLTGHRADQVLGRTLDVIVPTEYQDRHWHGFRSAMEAGRAEAEGAPIDLPVHCGDGEVRRFPTSFTLIRDARGHAIGAAAAIKEPSPDDPELYPL